MANNVFAKTLNLDTATWTRVADEPTVISCTVLAPSSNGSASNVLLRYDGGNEVEVRRDTSFPLVRVDVSLLEAKAGVAGDKLNIVGGSW